MFSVTYDFADDLIPVGVAISDRIARDILGATEAAFSALAVSDGGAGLETGERGRGESMSGLDGSAASRDKVERSIYHDRGSTGSASKGHCP